MSKTKQTNAKNKREILIVMVMVSPVYKLAQLNIMDLLYTVVMMDLMLDFSPMIRYEPRESNIEMLRRGIKLVKAGDYDGIKFDCFNEAEAKELIDQLSEEDRKLVRFTWLVFK